MVRSSSPSLSRVPLQISGMRQRVPVSSDGLAQENDAVDEEDLFGESDGVDRAKGKWRLVDGIPDPVNYFQICGLFGHIGSLVNVFV